MSTEGRALLLMRSSAVQTWCANTLFRQEVIDRVFQEEGTSFEPEGWGAFQALRRHGPGGLLRRVARDLRHFSGNPLFVGDYYVTRLATRELMNRRRFHEDRILGPAARVLDPNLPVIRGRSVNDPSCRALIQTEGYRLVFVFGTGLLKEPLLSESRATFVNLHWGWAPRYRGEGIISALTEEGPQGLGVTVHTIDRGIDSGPILYRERLIPEPGDNVYAIGLRLTVLGVQLFLKVYEDFLSGGLRPIPQRLTEGRLYQSAYLKTHYQLLGRARRILRALHA